MQLKDVIQLPLLSYNTLEVFRVEGGGWRVEGGGWRVEGRGGGGVTPRDAGTALPTNLRTLHDYCITALNHGNTSARDQLAGTCTCASTPVMPGAGVTAVTRKALHAGGETGDCRI